MTFAATPSGTAWCSRTWQWSLGDDEASDTIAGSDVPVEVTIVLLGPDRGEDLASSQLIYDLSGDLLDQGQASFQVSDGSF